MSVIHIELYVWMLMRWGHTLYKVSNNTMIHACATKSWQVDEKN